MNKELKRYKISYFNGIRPIKKMVVAPDALTALCDILKKAEEVNEKIIDPQLELVDKKIRENISVGTLCKVMDRGA